LVAELAGVVGFFGVDIRLFIGGDFFLFRGA
jgi:hypothetical protein